MGVTLKRLTRYQQKVVLAAMLEGKSMPSNIAARIEALVTWPLSASSIFGYEGIV